MWDWSSDSAISEDPCLMWCDSVSLGKQLPSSGQAITKFWRHHIPSKCWKLRKEQHSISPSCDVTLCHWASNYQVLKASYPSKMLETMQGTTQHLTLMWCDSVSLGEQSPYFEGIIIIWNSTNDRVSLPRRWESLFLPCFCLSTHTFYTKCMQMIHLIINYTCPK